MKSFLHQLLAVVLCLAALATGQQALAETVTYTISGSSESNGNVNLVVTASGDATGTVSDQWAYASTQSRSLTLPGSINLSFGSDKTSSLAVAKESLVIQANASDGGYITLSHASKYIYHVTLKGPDDITRHEAWNLTNSYTYRFQLLPVHSIVVEYATAIPITDAEISGINAQYIVSDAAVKPTPTVTWHGTTLTKNTHYTVTYQNNTSAGTATVRATGRGIFSTSTSVSKNYTLVWATYTVQFNKNSDSASGTMSDMAFTYATAQSLTANVFTRTGYTFSGWNTEADGTGTAYTDGQSVTNLTATNGATVTLYAQWTPIHYTVHFESNGGPVGGGVSDQIFIYDVPLNLFRNNYSRTGYTFAEWNTKADGTGTGYTDRQEVMNLSATNGATVTLYAQWTANTYVVHFDTNGGTGTMSDQAFTYDQAQNLIANAFTRTGYTFYKWRDHRNGIWYTDGDIARNLTASDGDTVTLYAYWTPITYTVRYYSNALGVDGSLPDQTFTYDEPQALTANAFTRTGYTFAGWNTAANGTGTAYADGQEVTNLRDTQGIVPLYAQWTPITYTIQFNKNGGTGTMANQTFTYDQTQALTANVFTRVGYTFSGWTTNADGTGTAYTDGQEVTNLRATAGSITLYAQWTPITLTYIGEDGQGHSLTYPAFTYITSSNSGLTLGDSNDDEGWYVVSGEQTISGALTFRSQASHLILCDGATLTVTPANGRGIYTFGLLTLYGQSQQSGTLNASSNSDYSDNAAIHTKGNLTVNGGIVNATVQNRYAIYSESSNVTINGGTVTATSEDPGYGRGISASNGTVTINGGDVTINAGTNGIYSRHITITDGHVVANGDYYGLSASNGGDVTISGGRVTASGNSYGIYCTRNITLGWTNASDSITASSYRIGSSSYGYILKVADGQVLTDGTDLYTGTLNDTQRAAIAGKTLVPYIPPTYTVRFNANGGEGTMSNMTTGQLQNLTANAFTRTGYTFSGWNTKADGTGTAYTDGESVLNITADDGAVIDLYAQWTPVTYTVHFDANGGEGTMSDQSFYYTEEKALTANAFTRPGYTFAGWNTKADGTGTAYTDGESVLNITADDGAVIDLYAQWTFIGVPYIDADGTEKLCTSFTLITGSNSYVSHGNSSDVENWYVVSGQQTISGTLTFRGQASHLILCDGATLTVTPANGRGIYTFGLLTLYGQSQQSGTLNANGNSSDSSNAAIYTKGNLTVNGGIVNATVQNRYAIYSESSNVTINGGTVTATSEDPGYGRGISASNGTVTINGGDVTTNAGTIGISSRHITITDGHVVANGDYYGLSASNGGDVTITGGRVTANGNDYGIYASQNITLGWTNASDSITASSYRFGSSFGYILKVADGQVLTDGTDLYTGTLNDRIADLAGKTLVPYITISTGDVNGDGSVTMTDVPALVALVLSGSPYNPVADVNGDNRVSLADVTALVNMLR